MQHNDQQEKDYLKEMAPTLFGKKHEIPADAPKGYFDALPGKLQQRISAEKMEPPKGKIIRLINFQNIAIAAGIALLLALIPVLRHVMDSPSKTAETATVAYEIELPENVEMEVLADYVDEDMLYANIQTHELKSWHLNDDISDAAIIDYLAEESDPLDIISIMNN